MNFFRNNIGRDTWIKAGMIGGMVATADIMMITDPPQFVGERFADKGVMITVGGVAGAAAGMFGPVAVFAIPLMMMVNFHSKD